MYINRDSEGTAVNHFQVGKCRTGTGQYSGAPHLSFAPSPARSREVVHLPAGGAGGFWGQSTLEICHNKLGIGASFFHSAVLFFESRNLIRAGENGAGANCFLVAFPFVFCFSF